MSSMHSANNRDESAAAQDQYDPLSWWWHDCGADHRELPRETLVCDRCGTSRIPSAATAWWVLHLPTGNVLDEKPTEDEARAVLDEFLAADSHAEADEFRVVECV